MNVTLHQSNPHTTIDGHQATYCTCFDALTARVVARFQVVQLGEGVTQYRTMDRRTLRSEGSRIMFQTNARLYLRKLGDSPSEPLNAATFNQIGRQLNDLVRDLEALQIDVVDRAENMPRDWIDDEVRAAAHSLHHLTEMLSRVQDHPTPRTCTKCAGRGRVPKYRDIENLGQPCGFCGGSGFAPNEERLAS